MSAFDYNKPATTALNLLKRYGKNVPIVRNVPGTYDPVTGTETGGSTITGTIDCVMLSIGRQSVEGLDDRYVDGLITGRVRKAIISAKSATFSPATGDIITFDNNVWTVVSSIPLAPAGVPVIYTAGIMKQ